jgi:hypothetical protein
MGCPKKWEFLKNGMNMVDVLAIMPYYVELLMSQQVFTLIKEHCHGYFILRTSFKDGKANTMCIF